MCVYVCVCVDIKSTHLCIKKARRRRQQLAVFVNRCSFVVVFIKIALYHHHNAISNNKQIGTKIKYKTSSQTYRAETVVRCASKKTRDAYVEQLYYNKQNREWKQWRRQQRRRAYTRVDSRAAGCTLAGRRCHVVQHSSQRIAKATLLRTVTHRYSQRQHHQHQHQPPPLPTCVLQRGHRRRDFILVRVQWYGACNKTSTPHDDAYTRVLTAQQWQQLGQRRRHWHTLSHTQIYINHYVYGSINIVVVDLFFFTLTVLSLSSNIKKTRIQNI